MKPLKQRHTLLIISFSPIFADARVLKQVEYFSSRYTVVTCGYGESPPGVEHHVRIPDECPQNNLDGRLITLHAYRRAYERLGAVEWCKANLTKGSWDLVLANDIETAGVALWLQPKYGVHADLHEYAPRLHEENRAWNRRIRPFNDWICRQFVAKAQSWTTVSDGLAREYERVFKFKPRVVTNAAPYHELSPSPSGDVLRIVHSGACLATRNLLAIIEGVEQVRAPVSLDLFLTPNDPGLLEEIKRKASTVPGVRVHEPVPYRKLIDMLNGFDVGIHVLPPANFNNKWALPNKLFDYVQARLGVVVGPSPEMKRYVEKYQLGIVTEGFDSQSIASALSGLTSDRAHKYKMAAHSAAPLVSAEHQVSVWGAEIAALTNRGHK